MCRIIYTNFLLQRSVGLDLKTRTYFKSRETKFDPFLSEDRERFARKPSFQISLESIYCSAINFKKSNLRHSTTQTAQDNLRGKALVMTKEKAQIGRHSACWIFLERKYARGYFSPSFAVHRKSTWCSDRVMVMSDVLLPCEMYITCWASHPQQPGRAGRNYLGPSLDIKAPPAAESSAF